MPTADTTTGTAASLNLVTLLKERAETTPSKIAYTYIKDADFNEESITFGELDQRATAICQVLAGYHGLGNRALLALPPGLEFIAAFFACLYAGVIAVPIYPPRKNRSLNRFDSVARSSGARFALIRSDLMDAVDTHFKNGEALKGLIWLSVDTIGPPEGHSPDMPYIESGTPAFLQFTSGSTADPKGVVVTHGNILHNLRNTQETLQMCAADRGFSWLPHFHDMGLIGGILQAAYTGFADSRFFAPQLFLRKPSLWLDTISRYGTTLSGGPNLGYELCLQKVTDDQISHLDLSTWRVAITGAEPVRPSTLRRFAERFKKCGFRLNTFHPSYGLAESTLLVSAPLLHEPPCIHSFKASGIGSRKVEESVPGSQDAMELVSSGEIIGGQDVRIVDPDTRELLPGDRIGEIWISGESVASGYWNNSDATREHFRARTNERRHGCYMRTGDLGFIHKEQLYIAGRLKDVIIIGGINYFPHDIEETVRNCHPALADGFGAAFSVDDGGAESLAICHEIGRAFRGTDKGEIEDAVRKAVSLEHEILIDYLALTKFGALPKTSSGKIQRFRCREQLLNGELEGAGSPSQVKGMENESVESAPDSIRAPLDDVTLQLIDGIAKILRLPIDKMDPDKSLTTQGISSLRAIEIQAFVEETFEHRLEAEDFFDDLTVRQLSARINEGHRTG